MDTYFEYVYNLRGTTKFEKLGKEGQNAIISAYLKDPLTQSDLERAIEKETDPSVLNYISENLDLKRYFKSIIFTTATSSYVDKVDFNNVRAIVNLRKVNNIQHPNKLFRAVNTLLPDGGIYIGRLETYAERKNMFYSRFGRHIGKLFWMVDFVLHRVIPRIPVPGRPVLLFDKRTVPCPFTCRSAGPVDLLRL